MNARSGLLALAATIGFAGVAAAQDVMTVAKDHYRVLVEIESAEQQAARSARASTNAKSNR